MKKEFFVTVEPSTFIRHDDASYALLRARESFMKKPWARLKEKSAQKRLSDYFSSKLRKADVRHTREKDLFRGHHHLLLIHQSYAVDPAEFGNILRITSEANHGWEQKLVCVRLCHAAPERIRAIAAKGIRNIALRAAARAC